MSTELLALSILAGVMLGSIAWVPLALMLDRTPKAGTPVRVTLTSDVSSYQQAMKEAAS